VIGIDNGVAVANAGSTSVKVTYYRNISSIYGLCSLSVAIPVMPISQDAIKRSPDRLLKRATRAHSRHVEFLLTYWCS